MAKTVLMPKAGISVESCIIAEWLKKPGDKIAVGDILFSYETDKASFECESTEAGNLLECFWRDGDEVPVLTPVCAVGQPGDDVSALRPVDGINEATKADAAPADFNTAVPANPALEPESAVVQAPVADGKLKVSPRAKKLAAEQHVDLRLAAPTGPYGRIVEHDVRAQIESGAVVTSAAFDTVSGANAGYYAGTGVGGRIGVADLSAPAAASMPGEYEDVKFSGIRRAISKNMTHSLASIPQVTNHSSFDATEIINCRKTIKENGEKMGLPNITLGDMVLYAVTRLLTQYPDFNAHMLDSSTIRHFRNVHLGFACDTPRGLVVPVIKNAEQKSLAQISAAVKKLAAAAQDGRLSPDYMSGSTFTVSNLGAFGAESFTPVINPPETCILGLGSIQNRPYEDNGVIKLYQSMGLSLTYDHRAIDGAPAARFMQELTKLLENFTLLLVG